MATIAQVFPLAGVAGEVITLRGSGFLAGQPAQHVVTVGGVAASGITVVSTQELTAVVPAGVAAGPVDVTVSVSGGAVAILAKGFYALAAPAATLAGNLLQGGARAAFVDGRPVGFTDGPVRLAHELGFHEAEVEQELGAVKLFAQQERWRLTLALAEVSLEHLQLAFTGAAIVADGGLRTLTLGGGTPQEHSLLVQGPGPAGKLRDFFAYRAVVEEHDPLVIARDTPQRLVITFRLLPEVSLPVGQRVLRIAER